MDADIEVKKEEKYRTLAREIDNLETAVLGFAKLFHEMDDGPSTPGDNTEKEMKPLPTFQATYDTAADRIRAATERIQEQMEEMRTRLFGPTKLKKEGEFHILHRS